jgi:hypothetical protein
MRGFGDRKLDASTALSTEFEFCFKIEGEMIIGDGGGVVEEGLLELNDFKFVQDEFF